MLPAQDCRAEAERYGRLAHEAKSNADRERHLRMKRSYELMARSADFGTSLDDLLMRLRR